MTTLEAVIYRVTLNSNTTFDELATSIFNLDSTKPLFVVFYKGCGVFDLTNYRDNVINKLNWVFVFFF